MIESKFDSNEVIAAGHPPVAKGIVCVDFDGTIFPFGNMWGTEPPIAGAIEAVKALKEQGYTVMIFSSRFSKSWHDHEGWDHAQALREHGSYVSKMLEAYNIPYDGFTCEKIPAQAYFDDKAYRAEGDGGLLNAVRQFMGDEVGL